MRKMLLFVFLVWNTAHAENHWNIFCDPSKLHCGVGESLIAAEDAKIWLKVSFHERDNGDIQMYWIMPPSPNTEIVILEDDEFVARTTMTNCTPQYCDAHYDFSGEAKEKLFKTKEMQIAVVISDENTQSIPFDTTDLSQMLIKARPSN